MASRVLVVSNHRRGERLESLQLLECLGGHLMLIIILFMVALSLVGC
jgi:hypothetical protein